MNNSFVRTAAELEKKYLKALSGIKTATENQQNQLVKTNTIIEDFVKETTNNFEEVHKQLDKEITTWFYSGTPTLSNLPASQWTTDEEKDNHIADLYYDQATGYGYRFYKDSTTGKYGWLQLTDGAAVEALAIANAAKDTADSKRRVFVATPYVPYDVGDLWFNEQDLYRCQIAEDKDGTFNTTDWIKATKYTDDTYAMSVNDKLNDYYTKTETQDIYATKTSLATTESGIRGEVALVKGVADAKAKVFRTTPTVPYSLNDIYIKDNIVYLCTTAKSEGAYNPNDWTPQVDYGDPVQWTDYDQRVGSIELKASKVVDDTGAIKSASIMTAINGDTSEVKLSGDKISLNGQTIDLTGDNITISSDNFNVDKDGNITCNNASMNNASIDGGSIVLNSNSQTDNRLIINDTLNENIKWSQSGRLIYWTGKENGEYIRMSTAMDNPYINLMGKDLATGEFTGLSLSSAGISYTPPSGNTQYLFQNKELLSTGAYMTDTQTYTFSEPVSDQPNGIVLVWSAYDNGIQDYQWHTDFIPKQWVANHNGNGITCIMSGAKLYPFCAKYVYISDTQIRGHADNKFNGTNANGIKLQNDKFVLRYVIGV